MQLEHAHSLCLHLSMSLLQMMLCYCLLVSASYHWILKLYDDAFVFYMTWSCYFLSRFLKGLMNMDMFCLTHEHVFSNMITSF